MTTNQLATLENDSPYTYGDGVTESDVDLIFGEADKRFQEEQETISNALNHRPGNTLGLWDESDNM